jgi:cytochrome c551/c552/glucose/arabinose dehydrogenase
MRYFRYQKLFLFIFNASFCLALQQLTAQNKLENEYYKIITLPAPEDVLLEVGGLALMPAGDLAISTRRGDIWLVKNPYMIQNSHPVYTRYASGLHEILGLAYKDGALYCAQRGELTRLADHNKDGKADVYETIANLPISGHYHEYTFGPKLFPDGSMMVTGNVAFGNEEWWRGESRTPYRGWAIRIQDDGTIEPFATGMRSPCGIGMIDGTFWYGDNQGDWIGSGFISPVKKGDFFGHPAGLRWVGEIESPVTITTDSLYAKVNPRKQKDKNGNYIKPENLETERGQYLYELKKDFPAIRPPAVWLPHGIIGISTSEIVRDETGGAFGPFEGQLFVGDQGKSNIARVFTEEVNGEIQGGVVLFREGFQSGVLRMVFGTDGSMFVGETNRGWGSAGTTTSGIERLVWTGKTPFEIKTIKAMADGFEIEFTKPANKTQALKFENYAVESFIYKYHPAYGSPPVDKKLNQVEGIYLAPDASRVRLKIAQRRPYYIHEIRLQGIQDQDGQDLVHPTAYYTLNQIPDQSPLVSYIPRPAGSKKAPVTTSPAKTGASSGTPTLAEIQPLLTKHTCFSCHQPDKRMVGPSYKDIAKRNYTAPQIVELIYKPNPKNWPDYSSEMASMTQVPREDALRIARWIVSLK